jgi:hypothetical protein
VGNARSALLGSMPTLLVGKAMATTDWTRATTCALCPEGKSTNGRTSQLECVAIPGYIIGPAGYTGPNGPDDGPCLACVAGSYKSTAGSLACTFCGVWFYRNTTVAVSVESCVPCSSDSYSVEGSACIDQCYCNPRYLQTLSHNACSQ